MSRFSAIINKIRSLYGEGETFIPLHAPVFIGNEKKYLNNCIDSTFVSSVGEYVDEFENKMCEITGAKHAIATMNGTAALHLSLVVCGVQKDDLIVTQALSFVATANAILYTGATPYFIDVDRTNLGMSADSLEEFLKDVSIDNGQPVHQPTGKRVGAIVPMHTFGLVGEIEKIIELANTYNIPVVEDAAESLGSTYREKHSGTFGKVGAFSFNGNKIVTSGGGGILVTDDPEIAKLAKHLSTQAKISHPWEYRHDHMGYNYRCPNINAALACAQLENLSSFVENKRQTAKMYEDFFRTTDVQFISESKECRSNYWLNAVLLPTPADRDLFLEETNGKGVMTRPVWTLLNKLEHLQSAPQGNLENSIFIEQHLVNIPSSVRL